MEQRRILFVPLDWGLGHATRILPLIREAVAAGDRVWIGGNGRSGAWLRSRFPELPFEEAPAWTPVHRGSLVVDFVRGIAGYWRSLKADREWAREVAGRLQLTHLVSDHRLGLRADRDRIGQDDVQNVLVIHQLTIALPLLWRCPGIMQWFSVLLWEMLRPYWSSFHEIWIPDSSQRSLALAPHLSMLPWVWDGALWSAKRGQDGKMPCFRYLGWCSRFEGMSSIDKGGMEERPPEESAILVVLSGPEPARSRLETKVIAQWQSWGDVQDSSKSHARPTTLWLVRGVPDAKNTVEGFPMVKGLKVWNSPDDQTMYSLLTHADWIVGRPGYSSLMDYACLRSTATRSKPWRLCTVPASGHSEQAYLGFRLKRLGQADFRSETAFDLHSAWLDRIKFKFTYAFS